jgi:hypothetical protein
LSNRLPDRSASYAIDRRESIPPWALALTWVTIKPTIFVFGKECSAMSGQPSSDAHRSARDWGMTLKTVLTAVMSLLSLLVVVLGGLQKDVMWLWIGFVCCLISGIFIQLFLNRVKSDVASGRR